MRMWPEKLPLRDHWCVAAWIYCVGLAVGFAACACASAPLPLRSLKTIHQLTNAEADGALPVDFTATVTYYRVSNRDLFMQDEDAAIFVHFSTPLHLVPGDRVRVQGTTHGSFHPYIEGKSANLVGHGQLPQPA